MPSKNSGSSNRAFQNKKNKSREKEVHIISGHVHRKVSCFDNATHVYQLFAPHVAHALWPFYPPPAAYLFGVSTKRPSQLKGTRFLLHYLNHFIELMLKLSNVNLVTRMQPWPAPNPPPHSHNPNVHRTHHIELHVHHTDKCWQLKHKVQVWLTRAPSPLTSR